ncbi:MOSC domain-containing protein [Paragemmobacter straminiformis]|uniref:MOSC domain-containing protein n=1 Tax=Paragemmobacter straminiformis TaxID=2045119 RepID=A0A842I4A9_9RHOB|nr:MOSC N-terminal beta barrel domain-containing protein [Gemmobacter straminiformis]MBC2834247.1 MOSC domain-containing protein [Gemmobacter straminiformis]
MTGGRLTDICRHPIKGHGREDLASVLLSAGACLPWDRHWAVAHEAAKLVPGWNPCVNFARAAKAPMLMAITSRLDEATGTVTLHHPDRGSLTFRPDDAADLPRFLDWVAPLNPANRAQPAQIVTAGRGMTDSDFPSVAILNRASLADLSARMGHDLSIHRWRGNLWLDGAPAWSEWDWIGRSIRIGGATLTIRERITRCSATTVEPDTGVSNADTLSALESHFGHQDFGLYATVTTGGTIAVGDAWSLT